MLRVGPDGRQRSGCGRGVAVRTVLLAEDKDKDLAVSIFAELFRMPRSCVYSQPRQREAPVPGVTMLAEVHDDT